MIRLALVGCGAITEAHHLPEAMRSPLCEVTLLVDANAERAQQLATRFGVPHASSELDRVAELANAAVVAVPNHLHAPIASQLLERGVHVLLEKPMGLNAAECDRIQAAEAKSGAVLALGHPRRHWASTQFVKAAIDAKLIGEIEYFEVRDGWEFAWPLKSPYLFQREKAGGGCLMDMGPHLADLLIHWLGDLEVLAYRDDSRGGVEANCEAELRATNGATGFIEFTRTRELRNTILLRGTRGVIEMGAEKRNQLAISVDGVTQLVGEGLRPTKQDGSLAARTDERKTWRRDGSPLWSEGFDALMRLELEDFLEAVRGDHPPRVPGAEGRRSIELVEACYRVKQDLVPPWLKRMNEVSGARR